MQPGEFRDDSERKRYKKANVVKKTIFRTVSGCDCEEDSMSDCIASTRTGSRFVTASLHVFLLEG